MVPRELCTRKVTIEDRSYMAHPRACFFCKHLENVVWDYTHGPYMFFVKNTAKIQTASTRRED